MTPNEMALMAGISICLQDKEINNILDEIKKEIEEKFAGYDICEYFEDYDYEENDISEYRSVGNVNDIIDIVDKYRKE